MPRLVGAGAKVAPPSLWPPARDAGIMPLEVACEITVVTDTIADCRHCPGAAHLFGPWLARIHARGRPTGRGRWSHTAPLWCQRCDRGRPPHRVPILPPGPAHQPQLLGCRLTSGSTAKYPRSLWESPDHSGFGLRITQTPPDLMLAAVTQVVRHAVRPPGSAAGEGA